jgi:hypothetical protein
MMEVKEEGNDKWWRGATAGGTWKAKHGCGPKD